MTASGVYGAANGMHTLMLIWWGEQLIHLYNDGYTAILGAKYTAALARPAPVVWSEVRDVAGPRAEFAMHRDEGTYDEALPFIMLRKGYPEETYVTFSYSPIPEIGADWAASYALLVRIHCALRSERPGSRQTPGPAEDIA